MGAKRRMTTLVPRVTTHYEQRRRQQRQLRTRTHDDDDVANVAFKRRNPRREGEQRASQVFARLTLLFRSHTATQYKYCNAVQILALHHRTGLLKGHSCGPQVVIVRTSDGRPCTDIVQRDTV